MDFFHVCFLLSQACLGEINDNFKRIYFSMNGKQISLYFILNDKSHEDEEVIRDEIMFEFSLLIDNFLEASSIENDYNINSKIFYTSQVEFFRTCPDKHDVFIEFYRRSI